MKTIKNVVQGFTNLVLEEFGKLDEATQYLSMQRHNHCVTCHFRLENTCSNKMSGPHVITGELKSGCGCNLAAKCKAPGAECPLGKWKSVQEWALIDVTGDKYSYQHTGGSLGSVIVTASDEQAAKLALYKII